MRLLRRDGSGLLGWYPAPWRHRYGDEFDALMEDTLDGMDPTPRLMVGVAVAGLRERLHEAGVLGTAKTPSERVRAGSLVVLCAWTAFVVAGGRFAKYTEHFGRTVPRGARAVGRDAYDVVALAAAVGGVAIVTGALLALPAFVRFLRSGGWPAIRRPVWRAVGATAVVAVAVAGLLPVAHSLTPAQRNGGSWPYFLAFVVAAILMSITLVLWTAAAVATARRLEFSRRLLAGEAALAALVTATMVVMTGATATWWGTVASSAPWVLQGTPVGSAASAFEPQLAATMVLMLTAAGLAVGAMVRVARSWREWRLG